MNYPNDPKLYEVERHVRSDTADDTGAHLQSMRKGKNPLPPTTGPAKRTTNPQEHPKPNQTTPTDPLYPATATQGSFLGGSNH